MSKIRERIREVRTDKKLSHWDFSLKISEKENRLKSVEYGRQNVPASMVQSIVQVFHVNAHWLLTGEGEMYQSKSSNTELKSTVSVTASASQLEKLIHNHRKAKISAFIDYWFATKSKDEQVWFEVQLGHAFSQYADFLDNKEIEEKLRDRRAG